MDLPVALGRPRPAPPCSRSQSYPFPEARFGWAAACGGTGLVNGPGAVRLRPCLETAPKFQTNGRRHRVDKGDGVDP